MITLSPTASARRGRVARGLLAAAPLASILYVTAVSARVLSARPERVWLLALLPVAALLIGPRTRATVMVAIGELAALLPIHAWITLLRAARLEGG